MITRNSASPLYLQIKENLEAGIKSGKYPVGSKLPSEKELCSAFNVSRITVRQALELLENRGMTESVHGKGTFVKARIISSSLQKISSFGETLERMGYSGFTRITSYEKKSSDSFGGMMSADGKGTVTHLTLTGYSMNEPVVYYRSAICHPYGERMYRAALELESKNIPFSTFDLYPIIGLEIGKINQQVAAVNADPETAEILNLSTGDAVLVLSSVILDTSLQPVEYKKGYYCTDKYSFNLNREL